MSPVHASTGADILEVIGTGTATTNVAVLLIVVMGGSIGAGETTAGEMITSTESAEDGGREWGLSTPSPSSSSSAYSKGTSPDLGLDSEERKVERGLIKSTFFSRGKL